MFEIRRINIMEDKVSFHKSLLKDVGLNAETIHVASEDVQRIGAFYPPIFQLRDDEYLLLARHWSFSIHLRHEEYTLSALVLNDDSLIAMIQEFDKTEAKFMRTLIGDRSASKTFQSEKPENRSTQGRKEKRMKGLVCPKCQGCLRRPNRKDDRKIGDYYRLRCENIVQSEKSKYYGRKCDFQILLTAPEYELYERGDLKIADILVVVRDVKCQKCTADIFKRMVHGKDGTVVEYLVCVNTYSVGKKCDYKMKVQAGSQKISPVNKKGSKS